MKSRLYGLLFGLTLLASAIYSPALPAADPIHQADRHPIVDGPGRSWRTYGGNYHHTFTNSFSELNKANIADVDRAWSFEPGDAVTASPMVVAGTVYVGSWDGFFYALDRRSGSLRWKFQVDCQHTVSPIPPHCLAPGQQPPSRVQTDGGIITSSATLLGGRVYFAAGKTLYALRAHDGGLLWKTVICGNPDRPRCETDANDPTRIFSSPVVIDRKVIIGHTVDEEVGYRGGIKALDMNSGRIEWSFEVDPKLDQNGRPLRHPDGSVIGQNRGCGNVWSSGAVDERQGLVFFGTADCQRQTVRPFHNALLALRIEDGALQWLFRPRHPENACDFDFGASANVIDFDGQRYIGIGSKDGTYYLVHARPPRGETRLVWNTNVVFGGFSGGFIGSTAFDGRRIFGGTAYGELGSVPCDPTNPRDSLIQDPSFHAFDADTGAVLWQRNASYTFAPTSVSNGLVFNGSAGLPPNLQPSLRVFDADNGEILLELPQVGAVNAGVTIVGDSFFFGTGNSFDGAGSSIQAYKLEQ